MQLLNLIIVCLFLYFPITSFSQEKIETENHRQNISTGERSIDNAISNSSRTFSNDYRINDQETRTELDKILLDSGFLLSEEITLSWDGSDWVNKGKFTYNYDANNNMIEELEQRWDGSYWTNFREKYSYTYDANNNMIEELIQEWDGSNWVDKRRNTNTFDGNNTLLEMLRQDWDGSNWGDPRNSIYTYDTHSNLIEVLTQSWDGSGWVDGWKSTYTFDVNNNMIEYVQLGWIGSYWNIGATYTYSYDTNNNLIEEILSAPGARNSKISYSYSENNQLIERIIQDWWDNAWLNSWVDIYVYNNNSILTEELSHVWDGSNWVDNVLTTYTHDENNDLMEQFSQWWDGVNWVNSKKSTFTYIVTEIEQFTNDIKVYSLSNNYPNPFNPTTTIKYTIPVNSRQYTVGSQKQQSLNHPIIQSRTGEMLRVELVVYDILGREVATLVNEHQRPGRYQVKFYANNVPSGVYFYKLRSGNYIDTKKMILLR